MASRLEKILCIGLTAALVGCGKPSSDSSTIKKSTSQTAQKTASELYKEYKSSQGEPEKREKLETREEAEKKIVDVIQKYFESSKKQNFNDFWGCYSPTAKRNLYDASSGAPDYEFFWTNWARGNPILEKINSIKFEREKEGRGLERATADLKYAVTYPYMGIRYGFQTSEFYFKRENGKWGLFSSSFNSAQVLERMDPSKEPRIKVIPEN